MKNLRNIFLAIIANSYKLLLGFVSEATLNYFIYNKFEKTAARFLIFLKEALE